MPLSLADNLNPDIDRPLDARSYWPSLAAALDGIKPTQRTEALFIWIGDRARWYQFQGGLADENLQPAPFEVIKRWYTQLPLPDAVRDTQDVPIGTTAVFRNGNAPTAGWLRVRPGSRFDGETYPSLYAHLGGDVFPDETSDEGQVWIKAEQVSLTRSSAMTVFPYTGGLYDQLFANTIAAINALWADLNYNEEMRHRILTELLMAPAGMNDSWTTVHGRLHAFKQTLVVMLDGKGVSAAVTEPFLDLIKKVGEVRVSPDAVETGIYVPCRIGATQVRATCPGPGWLECDGRELDTPDTTGKPLLYPEYYDWVYNAIGAPTDGFGPYALATPDMTSETAPCGRMSVFIGTVKQTISNVWYYPASSKIADKAV